MRCREIMKKDVECVSATDTAQAAAKRMRDVNVGFLPVCDQSKRVLGTITDRDLAIRVLADASPSTTRMEDVMTREVVCCRPDDELRLKRALQLLSGFLVGCLIAATALAVLGDWAWSLPVAVAGVALAWARPSNRG